MKRPIAEFLTMAVKAGAEREHAQYEHEAWQILRRKQGYVTHRIYESISAPSERLVYSEWESKKAVDGARQHLRSTPLGRRARAALTAAPQRRVGELVGRITSAKGLDLPDGAIAASAMIRLADDASGWRETEAALWKTLSSQPGYLMHVLLRDADDPLFVGAFSHWTDPVAFEQALTHAQAAAPVGAAAALATLSGYVCYRRVRE